MDKIYTPEIVPENPFPGGELPILSTSSEANGIYSPTVARETSLPRKKASTELISQALNTRSRNILQEFDLQQSGGLKIGDYKEGVSGDLRLTPNGLTARDVAGNTTFSIDGTTGDAVFAGKLQSGTVITGEVVLGDGSVVLDDLGLSSTTNFLKGTTTRGNTQQFTTTSFVDVTSSNQTIVLERTTNILFLLKTEMYLTESVGNTGNGTIFIDIDGAITNNGAIFLFSGNNYRATHSLAYVVALKAGTRNVKLKAKLETIFAGSPVLNVVEYYFTYIKLGS